MCAASTVTVCAGASGPAVSADAAEARWVFHAGGSVRTWRRQTGMFHCRQEEGGMRTEKS